MKGRNHKYGNASQVKVHGMADGGKVKPPAKAKPPMKPHVPAKIKDPIPKSKHKLERVKKADGGKIKSKKKARKPNPSMLGTGGAAKAGEAISGRQAQIDKALKDAGA